MLKGGLEVLLDRAHGEAVVLRLNDTKPLLRHHPAVCLLRSVESQNEILGYGSVVGDAQGEIGRLVQITGCRRDV